MGEVEMIPVEETEVRDLSLQTGVPRLVIHKLCELEGMARAMNGTLEQFTPKICEKTEVRIEQCHTVIYRWLSSLREGSPYE